jgi:hypothetical protein
MAIFSLILEIELKPCLRPLVLMSPFAMSKSQVGYLTSCWDVKSYGAVFGH